VANSKILVTGATGGTGGSAARTLKEGGHHVRALIHEVDERAEALRDPGIEIVTGDLLDIDSVRAALQDVRAAYFVYPLRPQILDGTVNFAQAAKEAGVTAIVNISQMTSRRDSNSHAARNHWLSEQVFDWCGIPVTHLRPTLFTEWLLYPFSWKDSAQKDTLALPFGNGRFAPISAEDQGRVIAAILADPVPHAGALYKLFGPKELDGYGIAAAISEMLGRTVRYSPIEVDEFLATLARMPPPYSDPFFTQHIGSIAIDCRNGITGGTNDTVERLTGRRPLSVQDFVEQHRAAFDPASRS
jgi:NAD(P)H dehydrogenase (quinone)